MLNQKKVEIFSRKFRKSLAKQFLEAALDFEDYIQAVAGSQLMAHSSLPKNITTLQHYKQTTDNGQQMGGSRQ